MIRNILNKLIAKGKGHEYNIDRRIPEAYLFGLAFRRLGMLMKGKLSGIKNKGRFFFAWSARVRARRFLKLGSAVTIGSHAYIDALSTNGVHLGNDVSVGRYTRIEATGNLQHIGQGMTVGDHAGLGIQCFYGCAGGISIGEYTIVGDRVSFHSENHIIHDLAVPIKMQGVTHQGIRVGNNCWIGAKSTILDGAELMDGCVIAAGAVVTAGIYLANGIYGGVPAKFIKYRNE